MVRPRELHSEALWSGGLVVWWSGGLVVWSGGLVVWRSGGLVVWWPGGLVVWWSGGLVVWWYGMVCYVNVSDAVLCYVVLCAVVVCYATHQRNSRPPDHQTTRPPDHQTTRPPDHQISASLCNSLGRTTRPQATSWRMVELVRWVELVRTPIGLGSNFWGKTFNSKN